MCAQQHFCLTPVAEGVGLYIWFQMNDSSSDYTQFQSHHSRFYGFCIITSLVRVGGAPAATLPGRKGREVPSLNLIFLKNSQSQGNTTPQARSQNNSPPFDTNYAAQLPPEPAQDGNATFSPGLRPALYKPIVLGSLRPGRDWRSGRGTRSPSVRPVFKSFINVLPVAFFGS